MKKIETEKPDEKGKAPTAGEEEEKPEGTPPKDETAPADDDQSEDGGEEDKEEEEKPSEPPAKKPVAKELPEAPPAKPAAPQEEVAAEQPVQAGENERLQADLLAARSQIAAYAAGVRPDMIQDAVTLATAQAGEATEEAVANAMAEVLGRHPEWKAAEGGDKKKTGGFKLGADPDAAAGKKPGKGGSSDSKKRWNRFK